MAASKPPKRRRAKAKPAGSDVPPEPWEQQPGESSPAFQAFARYRDAGPDQRSVRRVARDLGKSGSLIGEWSTKNRWVERARAWDLHLDRIKQRELEDRQVEAAERHALMVAGSLQATSVITQKFLEKVTTEEGAKALDRMAPDDLAQLAIAAARVQPRLVPAERLSLGLSTTNVAGHAGKAIATESDHDERARHKSDDDLKGYLLGGENGAGEAPQKDSP